MHSDFNANTYELAVFWAEKLRTDPAYTDSDVEELKGHLIDLTEELIERGLNVEEAFSIASARLGDAAILKEEFEEANASVIQMRKTILVLSGILIFFLLYFLMVSFTRMLFLGLSHVNDNPVQNIRHVFYFVTAYHLFFIASTFIIYFFGSKMKKKIETLKIKPHHTFWLFTGIIVLAIFDQWFRQLISAAYKPGNYNFDQLYALFDYSGYSFPLIMIICFVLLYKRFHPSNIQKQTSTGVFKRWSSIPDDIPTGSFVSDEEVKNQLEIQIKELEKIGLDEDEACKIALKRIGRYHPQSINRNATEDIHDGSINSLLIIFSGVLVYFFLYFLLFSSAHILFTVLQYYENSPILNIKRTWSYVMIYHLMFIFFTASIFLLDRNIIQPLKQLKIKPSHTFLILFATILLAIVDRIFYPISKYSINADYEMKTKLFKIFLYSNYSFPFIICACFLVLFYKYYRDNVKVGS